MRGLSLVVASGGHSSSRCAGLSLSWPLLLRGTGSRRAGSVVVAHGPSCSAARGILPDQGSNPCPLHWQADSQPLHHQGSPKVFFKKSFPGDSDTSSGLVMWTANVAPHSTYPRIKPSSATRAPDTHLLSWVCPAGNSGWRKTGSILCSGYWS